MFHGDIKKLAKENTNFREVLYTGDYSQLVLMSIPRGEDIGEEKHPDTDQILFLVEGEGESVLEGQRSEFKKDEVVFVPAGTMHNFINTGQEDLKLYTIYCPAEHKPGTVHKTKEDAGKDTEDHPAKTGISDADKYENF